MFIFGLAHESRGFDPLVLLLAALVAEAVVGELRALFRVIPHPVRIMGGAVGWLEGKLNRERRGEMDRALRGAFVVVVVAGMALGIGWGVAWLSQTYAWGAIPEFLLLVTLIAQRGLYARVRAVGLALQNEGLAAAREKVSRIVGRDPERLDVHGVARAGIESAAENFCDAVVAPVFWYVLFGFPGLLVYKAVNTMDSMIGHRTERHRAFGFAAARLDDVLNLIPARLSGLFLVMAAGFVPSARPAGALKIMLRDAGKHRSPNAGWPEAAMAGALGIALAGPRRYGEEVVEDPFVNDAGRKQVDGRDIRSGVKVFWVSCVLLWLLVAAAALVTA